LRKKKLICLFLVTLDSSIEPSAAFTISKSTLNLRLSETPAQVELSPPSYTNKRHFFPYIVYAQKQKKTKHSKDRQNEKTIIAIDKMIMKKKRESFVF